MRCKTASALLAVFALATAATVVSVEVAEAQPSLPETTTTLLYADLTHCDCVGADCDTPSKRAQYHFIRLLLDALQAAQHPYACRFVAAWYQLEVEAWPSGSLVHNPMSMKPNGKLAEYLTAEHGARVLAQQLDGTLLTGGGHRKSDYHYPALTSILRDARYWQSAETMSRNVNVRNEMRLWCGCLQERLPHRYEEQLTRNLRANRF